MGSIWGQNMFGYLSLDITDLFLVAHSFPRASLSENCSFLGTDNVRGQISELIIQQIVTLSKYGHDALDICHP